MKIKVAYIFSRNKKIGSKLISWGTKHLSSEPNTPSHIAMLINERWVFESTLDTGVRVIPYFRWKEINEEIAQIQCPDLNRTYSQVKAVYKEIQDKKYDWFGVLYFGVCLFLNKYFKKPIPEVNKWESEDKYFCTEAAGKLTGRGRYSMSAPVQLLEEFRNGKA